MAPFSFSTCVIHIPSPPWLTPLVTTPFGEAVLRRSGCVEAKRVAGQIVEEWALRSVGVAAGAGGGARGRLLRAAQGHCPRGAKRAGEGALDRLLRAAQGHCPRGAKRALEEDQDAEDGAEAEEEAELRALGYLGAIASTDET
eukprot:Skav218832  [mRNA]  locus=scaffold3029:6325:6753:- [translate_table: standard]